MKKIKNNIRLIIQFAFFAVTNGYIKGYTEGKIFTGKTKMFCLPGLNCYSCPGALGACPLGALQNTFGNRDFKFAFYVLGVLMLFGIISPENFADAFKASTRQFFNIICGK